MHLPDEERNAIWRSHGCELLGIVTRHINRLATLVIFMAKQRYDYPNTQFRISEFPFWSPRSVFLAAVPRYYAGATRYVPRGYPSAPLGWPPRRPTCVLGVAFVAPRQIAG